MKLDVVKDKLLFAAARLYSKGTMAETAERQGHVQHEMTVVGVEDLNEVVRRVTFVAPELKIFELAAPDEFFGLLFPGESGTLTLPDGERANVRAAITDLPEEDRPGLRWYTIRAHRPEVGEIDVDIITHGTAGPGSAWTLSAQVGDVVGFRSGGGLYRGFEYDGTQLLVADETAVPALAAILDERDRRGLGDEVLRLHVEVPSADVLDGMGLDARIASGAVRVHARGSADPGTVVEAALREAPDQTAGLDYAWLCGESALATGLRRHLVKDLGVDKHHVLFSGYWKLGAARG